MSSAVKTSGLGLLAFLLACSWPRASSDPSVNATVQAANQAIATQMAFVAAGTAQTAAAPSARPALTLAPPIDDWLPAPPAAVAPARLVVTGAGAEGLSLRAAPATRNRLKVLKYGTELIALGEEQQAEDRAWLRVKGASGTEGWVAPEFAVTSVAPAP